MKVFESILSQASMARLVVSTFKLLPDELVIEVDAPSTAPEVLFYIDKSLFAINLASSTFSTLIRAPAHSASRYESSDLFAIAFKFLYSSPRAS